MKSQTWASLNQGLPRCFLPSAPGSKSQLLWPVGQYALSRLCSSRKLPVHRRSGAASPKPFFLQAEICERHAGLAYFFAGKPRDINAVLTGDALGLFPFSVGQADYGAKVEVARS